MYPIDHDFLHHRIDHLHDTPMQRKFRKLAPMPCGVVFLPWPGMTEAEARSHFRLMRELGFTCLKQTMPTPEWPTERTLSLALEEGIIPYWYAEGGYEDITPELLTRLGLPADLDIDAALAHPVMVAHQRKLIAARITRQHQAKPVTGDGETVRAQDWVPSVVGDERGHEIKAETLPHFIRWLKVRYGTIEALKEAWNTRHVGLDGWRDQVGSWEDLERIYPKINVQDYRHLVDAMKFRAEAFIRQYVAAAVDRNQAIDPHEPMRAGGEMGLFLSFASRGTDMEGMALEMARGGSFYPSLHLAWHFEEVEFEVARPVYIQASTAADWAKGIWSATWESTGGPQYFSGGKAPFVPEARDKIPGFTTDAGTMTQLVLSYFAAGFRGFGMWAWNYRTAGWEAGEYSMLDRNRKPNERARQVGALAKAARKWRRELWQAHKEPLVGILHDWDSDAMWAAMGVAGRDRYRQEPVRARIGAARAFIDANVPWEFVTTRNLDAGLAPRYPVIYIPAHIALSHHLQDQLLAYVEQGGRVVLDLPGAYYDEYGRIFPTAEGTVFEKIFGATLDEFAYSNPRQQVFHVEGVEIDGFTARVTPTSARVLATFANGDPAIIENRRGKGSAVMLVFQAAMTCWKPGSTALQELMVRHSLGALESPFRCTGALAYRQAAPQADHYFLINPDPAKTVVLDPWAFRYASASDAVTGEAIDLARPIALPSHGGRWIRCAKA